jgi:hypothetical protein
MNLEKWQDILGNIKDNFKYENESEEHLDDEGGVDVHSIEFQGPLGRMRLEYISKPVILDKKTTYSKRIGSETQVDYVYSDTEKSGKLMIYKWDESQDDWVEVDAEKFSL